ncbi:MAG: phospholipase D-like domain-containing protein [Halobacteriota archaeon]|uniref:phospholipase D-like domain-containing protein n=1 Tax=Natronomonas sp. TaxID=2184060 RepID=UPI0039760B52
MSARIVVIAVALVLAVGTGLPVPATASDGATTGPANATLVAAYPNPVADGDPGEFVTVRFDEATNTSGWTLTDGETTARLPNRTLNGTVAFSMQPSAARNDTDHRVEPLSGRLLLADDGDRLAIEAGDEPIATARYRNAPESALRDFESDEWRPIGATEHEPIRTDGGSATAFVLPDAPDRTVETVRSATDRIHVAGYTFTSERLADVLLERANDDVDVRVLLDGAPVGGISERQARQLDRLVDGGVEVRLLAGPHRRYQHHHPKYAVVDDRALVSTENFKPAGTGGMSSRGWSVVLDDRSAAAALATVHESDWSWRAATPWSAYQSGRDFADGDPAIGEFDPRHEPERIDVEATTVLVAPDNAATELVSIVDAADDRVLVQQVRIDSRGNDLLRAVLRAADRGVRVRIHLGGSWYVEEDNAELVEWLNRRADAEGWDLEARVDDADGYEKIHTKGVIADDTAVVGSLNWVRSAQSDNREVLVALDGDEPAAYYASVFTDDWRESQRNPVPVGLFAVTAVAVSGALLLVRRIEFVRKRKAITDWQW